MLDENLPTFRLKPSSDNPLSSILYFSQNGSEPAAEYLFRRADPALPASRSKYVVALTDPYNAGVVYAEVTLEPEWSQPTLSGAELRAQAQAGAPPAPAVATVPDSFTVQLYNPDQAVTVKMVAGSWNKSDTWEFELPVQTFRAPTTSEIDKEQQSTGPAAADLIPRVMFRWKRDGLLSKDMTCYMTGTRLGSRKNKEPDITIGLFKASRESILTVYQPNLHRVEVEDRKGLELVLLLGAEAIKDLWLVPRSDLFNLQGSSGPIANGNKRKNSRPAATSSAPPPAPAAGPTVMSGALSNVAPAPPASAPAKANGAGAPPPQTKPDIDAETRRLQAMVEREQREQREREKADRAEQKRIKKMIEDEERERRRREAEVAKETDRLRKVYGVEGQQLPSDRPPLPPRSTPQSPVLQQTPGSPQQLSPWGWGYGGPPPMLPPRPVSAGPYGRPAQPQPQLPPAGWQQQQPPPTQQYPGPPQPQGQQGPFHSTTLNTLWKGAAGGLQQLQQQHQQHQGGGSGRKKEEGGAKVQKKRSSQW
ncbi:hypothetical protein C8A05DRAFT_31967 [Staphylotrichum tortipilum]|uniref:Uncharacterized protein n=1 Tax=Staphylotrichum tortipilum TaxID=2831512 RepID=A0AAN6MNL9_9PEZI|nr:hypothetical protein C8A05DRAFT_31967 [Staphylotrichum longicolle]